MLLEAVDQRARRRLLALEPHLQRLQPAQHEPGGVGRRDDPGEPAREVQAVAQLAVAGDRDAGEHVVVAGEDLRRAVEGDVAAVLERPEAEGGGHGRVADDGRRMCGCGLEVRHRQRRVRRRLEEDEVGPRGRGACLVELDHLDLPGRQVVEQLLVTVVGTLGERDRRTRTAAA